MKLNDLRDCAHRTSSRNGFWESKDLKDIATALALISCEVSESIEELRQGNPIDVELADVIIRALDLAGALNIDIENAVKRKMVENVNRPRKHGKLF